MAGNKNRNRSLWIAAAALFAILPIALISVDESARSRMALAVLGESTRRTHSTEKACQNRELESECVARQDTVTVKSGDKDIYDPVSKLAPQIIRLRKQAEGGNSYASCVLAWALDMCMRSSEPLQSGDYASETNQADDESSVRQVEEKLLFREKAESHCAGLDGRDLEDTHRWLLDSARAGHPRSMTKLALLPQRYGEVINVSRLDFAIAYRDNAESMLNRAAEAGDPQAILGIYHSYSSGAISSGIGQLPVAIDASKAVAAARVMLKNAKGEFRQELESFIDGALTQMDQTALSRLQRLESTYSRTYRNAQAGATVLPGELDDLPERACRDVLRR
jgi:hypothetical protein